MKPEHPPTMTTNPILMEALAEIAHCEPADVGQYFDALGDVTVVEFIDSNTPQP